MGKRNYFSDNTFLKAYSVAVEEPSKIIIQNYYHYTSLDGFIGITGKGEGLITLWFTQSSYLNDSSEGKQILSVYKKVCNDMLKDGRIDNAFYQLIKSIRPSNGRIWYFNDNRQIVDESGSAYICSFSKQEDSLNMWRYYSKGQNGYSLMIGRNFYDELKKDDEVCDVQAFEVIYDDDKKEEIISKQIGFLFDEKSLCDSEIKEYLALFLDEYRYRLKHESYKSEEEYRIVVKLRKKDNERVRKFRKSIMGLIPYIEQTVKIDVKEVCCGPINDEINPKETIKDYMKSKGFVCNVKLSQLPVSY